MLNPPCCDCKVLCPDPADPINNLSAERPDPELFIGVNHGTVQQPPPTGWTWGTPGCLSFCTSSVSQEDADLCAQRQQVQCTTQNCEDASCGGGGGDGGWHPPGAPGVGGVAPNPRIVSNAAETGTASCPDGLPFDFTLPAGSISGINQDYVNMVAMSLANSLAEQEKVCLNDIPGACLSQPYSAAITCTGGTPPFSILIISGALPPGITATQNADATALVLSGSPQATGLYTFTVFAQDSKGLFMQKTYQLGVLNLINAPPQASANQPYSFQFTAIGGTAPYTFGVVGGNAALPPGLTMDASGTIFGTPTVSGTVSFQVTVRDST